MIYDNAPRAELIAELKAWEGKFEEKVASEKANLAQTLLWYEDLVESNESEQGQALYRLTKLSLQELLEKVAEPILPRRWYLPVLTRETSKVHALAEDLIKALDEKI